MPIPLSRIRNFSIIAHIDHGKSTLADRLLEITGTVAARDMREQYLDTMDLERERGITIKAQSVRLTYNHHGEDYVLNLIDTPGHVDFTYEVSRSLAACEGALLLVDATQGVEAQTLANAYLAIENNLEIVPVVNKIDLPAAEPEAAADELAAILGIDPSRAVRVSAKTGEGVEDVLAALVEHVPPPEGDARAPLQALIFDSHYDQFRGVVTNVRVVNGVLAAGTRLRLMATGLVIDAEEVGVFAPGRTPTAELGPGEVGYLITGLKDVSLAKVGDTITEAARQAEPLPGYRDPLPMVYSGLYPVDGDAYADLREALERLKLNDAALVYEPEISQALGFGFRCGFLGLLHLEIVQERLEREYNLDLIATAPSVAYRAHLTNGQVSTVANPSELPEPARLAAVGEPYVKATIITPMAYVGALLELCQARRGSLLKMEHLGPERMELHYRLPLGEIVWDFFDQLKSRSRGYASLDYEPDGYDTADLVKVEILVNGQPVDSFSAIVHRDKAHAYGRQMTQKLRELIPRQLFDVPVQAAIGGRIIARETIRAKRKDVLAKCYGGDITRKRKLLERQKEGKKRMKLVGSVEVPQEAFIAALRLDQD